MFVRIYPHVLSMVLEAIEKYGALKGGPPGRMEDPAVQSFFKRRV